MNGPYRPRDVEGSFRASFSPQVARVRAQDRDFCSHLTHVLIPMGAQGCRDEGINDVCGPCTRRFAALLPRHSASTSATAALFSAPRAFARAAPFSSNRPTTSGCPATSPRSSSRGAATSTTAAPANIPSSPMVAATLGSAGVMEVVRVPCLSDNYVWLLHEAAPAGGSGGGRTAVVDPAEEAPVVEALAARCVGVAWRDGVWRGVAGCGRGSACGGIQGDGTRAV